MCAARNRSGMGIQAAQDAPYHRRLNSAVHSGLLSIGFAAKTEHEFYRRNQKGWPVVGSTCHPAPIVRSVDLTRLGGQCVVAASPRLRPQPTPPCKDQAVSVSGTGRPPPGARRAAVNKGQAPSIAVSTRFSSRELPVGEHRDAPVVTTLRGTTSVAVSRTAAKTSAPKGERSRLVGSRATSGSSS